MQIGIKTDVGKARDNNQDFYYISNDLDYSLFIIADGMGGHKAGEAASQMAIETIKDSLGKAFKGKNLDDIDIKKEIKLTIHNTNKIIFKKSKQDKKCSGMGTTVTLGFIRKNKVYIAHVGDSRAYIYKNNNLSQITTDHSLVEELIKNGSITKEEGRTHPQRNIITRAVGTSEDIKIDLSIENLNRGDILLLCTDGLTNMVNDKKIKSYLYKYDDIQIACEELVKLANTKGGYDNITILAAKI